MTAVNANMFGPRRIRAAALAIQIAPAAREQRF